ncbi:hypothetical protein DY000_02030837 [Brassica cretica]|uniref:Uncharacterized protein n=1 Tax=Brassica cretica TaxID=69181 RepID=A0ABQ7DPR2_BRACR|nr:hypothetical protein DY000_02030837 [Brassica cretica]
MEKVKSLWKLSHGRSSSRPPHAKTSTSSSPPFTANTIVFLSSRRSLSRRSRLNRSPDEAARASIKFIVRARVFHAPQPEIVAVAVFHLRVGVLRRRTTARRLRTTARRLRITAAVLRRRRCAMSGSMDFGVASHTSLSDFPVAYSSLFPFSGYPGVIRDVFAANQVHAVVPRVLLREIMCCKLVGIAFGLGCSSLRCVDIGVTLGFVCQFLALLIRLVRDGATILRCHPCDGLTVTTSRSVGFPKGKSSYCRSRWKFLLHACYMSRSYWIHEHMDFWRPFRWLKMMDIRSCRIFRLLQIVRMYLWPLERPPLDT